jgi:hypothetical protein
VRRRVAHLKKRRFGGTFRLYDLGAALAVIGMKAAEVILSSEASVPIRATLHQIPEDGIFSCKCLGFPYVRDLIFLVTFERYSAPQS